MFDYVCNVLSTKLPVIFGGELLAMIGLDESDERVFNRCVTNNCPLGDLHGNQNFTLAGMELTLDCDIVWSIHPIRAPWSESLSQNVE
jgi:hypothetical protein